MWPVWLGSALHSALDPASWTYKNPVLMDSLSTSIQFDTFLVQFFLHMLEPFSVIVYVLYYGVGFPYEGLSRLYNQSLLPWRSFPVPDDGNKPTPNPCVVFAGELFQFVYFNNGFHTVLFVTIAVLYGKRVTSNVSY